MATYAELVGLFNNSELRNRLEVACAVAAYTIQTEVDTIPNHVDRLKWARQAYKNPRATAEDMLTAVLASNKSATVAQIMAASDASFQSAVDDAVDLFATGIE